MRMYLVGLVVAFWGSVAVALDGPFGVEHRSDWPLARPGGGAPIPVTAYWPVEAGRYPVVLFSHGAGGSGAMSPEMMEAWARAGYVVLVPTHRSDLTRCMGPGLFRAVKEIRLRGRDGGAMWSTRVAELGALLDGLEGGSGLPPEVIARADPERVGLAGHSFGGYTALLVGGAVLYGEDGRTFDYRDSRVDAIAVLSGPGRDTHGLTTASFGALRLPLLVFAGSDDPGMAKEGGPEWRGEAFALAPAGPAYLAFVHGASHVSYVGGLNGAKGSGPGVVQRGIRSVKRHIFREYREKEAARGAMYDFTTEAARVFWDGYLKDDEEAREALRTGSVTEGFGELVDWSSK